MVSEATTDTMQPPALNQRRFICYMWMYHILFAAIFPKPFLDTLPNNCCCVAQHVHSEEKKAHKFQNYFCNIHPWLFQYFIKMFNKLCDRPFTSSKEPFMEIRSGAGFKIYISHFVWFLSPNFSIKCLDTSTRNFTSCPFLGKCWQWFTHPSSHNTVWLRYCLKC